MYNVGVIDEATLNAVRAALDERIEALEAAVAKAQHDLDPFYWGPGHPGPDDAQRALIWNNAALLETKTARDFFSESSLSEFRDHPADTTTETELRYAWGDR